uniref:Uncharacterized protein n=1 Tax=Arundo donax TaxID=35708 RepID=A0A0A9ASF4_ARUDO
MKNNLMKENLMLVEYLISGSYCGVESFVECMPNRLESEKGYHMVIHRASCTRCNLVICSFRSTWEYLFLLSHSV